MSPFVRIRAAVLAVAVLIAVAAHASPGQAARGYRFTIVNGSEALIFHARERGNAANATGISIARNAERVAILAEGGIYDLSFVLCNKTIDHVWYRMGSGVKITIQGCGNFSFVTERP